MDKLLLDILKDLKVLYVEDEEYVRNETLLVLKHFFNSVDIAENGKIGFDKFLKKTYDIVITDITMPVMDGIEMIKKIKDVEPEQIVIILSAKEDKESLLMSIEGGVEGYLLKPINLKKTMELFSKIARKIKMEIENKHYKNRLENLVEEKTKELIESNYRDKITNLYNYLKLMDSLDDKKKSLTVIDISNFRNINTAFGMELGDEILKNLSTYLQKLPQDFEFKLYRYKDSSFAMLHSETDEKVIQNFLNNLKHYLSKFYIVHEDVKLYFTFKVVSVVGDKNDLIDKIDKALSYLKRNNLKNIYMIFNNSDLETKKEEEIVYWVNKTIEAIKNYTIEPYFQAIVDNETKKVKKYEVLARMLDGDKVISPFFFIGPAEEAGILQDITKIIIEKSFKKIANTDVNISINITELDLYLDYLDEFLDEQLKLNNLKPNQITLEVLEGISSMGAEQGLKQLLKLKEKGFILAIDDFGTGFSNFERVYKMQPDFIKIDGVFIKNIDKDETSRKIASAIKVFAESIGAEVIAEFVSNEQVYNIVKELGIGYSQGYYFSEPSQELLEDI